MHMEGMGLNLTPVVVRSLLGPLGMFGPIALTLFRLIPSPNSPNRVYKPPLAAHPPPPPTPPL